MAIGWGALQEGGSVIDTLQQVTINIVDLSANTCAPLIKDGRYQLCAGVQNGGKGKFYYFSLILKHLG